MKRFIRKCFGFLQQITYLFKKKVVKPIIVPIEKKHLLDGKIALITGGNSGIGLAIAKSFVKTGAKVIIAGTNENKLKLAAEQIISCSNEEMVKWIILDVANVENIARKTKEAEALFEENRIDILVNSAGVGSKCDFWHTGEDEYDTILDINTKGTFFISKAVAELMIKRNVKGHILNVSSAAAERPAWTPYQISKWALKGMTLGLADILLPYGIVVNAIAPGPTATPMLGKNENDTIYECSYPSKRYLLAEEVASLAVHMVSGAGDMIVGDTFYITGGSGIISMHH